LSRFRHRASCSTRAQCPGTSAGRAGRLRIAVSRTRRPEVADALAAAVDADLVPMGSVGAKAAAVIAGVADL
jgi:3'(2'), 5'-bisphosphate nucleotidase